MVLADRVFSEQQLAKLIKILKVEKEKSLLSIQSSQKRRPKEARNIIDYFLISILANTGLRISEALNLKWSDVQEDFIIVRAENSKNGKRGTIYIGTLTIALFNELKALKTTILKRCETELIFSLTGKVLSRSYQHSRFKLWLRAAGLPETFHLHDLRHSFATRCLDKGLGLAFTREQLRHSSLQSTQIYIHVSKANREKVKDLF